MNFYSHNIKPGKKLNFGLWQRTAEERLVVDAWRDSIQKLMKNDNVVSLPVLLPKEWKKRAQFSQDFFWPQATFISLFQIPEEKKRNFCLSAFFWPFDELWYWLFIALFFASQTIIKSCAKSAQFSGTSDDYLDILFSFQSLSTLSPERIWAQKEMTF